MTEKFFGNALWYLVKQSDMVTKLVLLILLFMSIICWTLFLYKIITTHIKRRQLTNVLHALSTTTTLEGLIDIAKRFSHTLPGYLITQSMNSFKHSLIDQGTFKTIECSETTSRLQEQIESSVNELVDAQDSYTSFLSVSVAVSPLLGLFGTVWGLVHSFVRIGELQTADIATVAPGIAEALITTLAGLMVAIPALVMYHYVINSNKSVERALYETANRIYVLLRPYCAKD